MEMIKIVTTIEQDTSKRVMMGWGTVGPVEFLFGNSIIITGMRL